MNVKLQGRFVIHKQKVKMRNGEPVLDENGEQIPIGEREKVAEFDNLITDIGLDNLPTKNVIDIMYLSTDTTEPLVSDVTLSGVIGWSTTVKNRDFGDSNTSGSPPYFITHLKTYRFIAGRGTGNISKIATGWGSTTSPSGLWSTALVKDSLGNNTTITKLDDETLDVTYQLKKHISALDYVGVHSISGVDYNIVLRISRLNQNWLGTITDTTGRTGITQVTTSDKDIGNIFEANGTSSLSINTGSVTARTYVPNSYQSVFDFSFDLNNSNHPTGIRSLFMRNFLGNTESFAYQLRLGKVSDDTPLMKTKDHTLVLPSFVFSWGRYVAP